jgi:small multidrug resistance pump
MQTLHFVGDVHNFRQKHRIARRHKIYLTFLIISGTCSGVASILLRIAGRMPGESFSLISAPNVLRVAAVFAYGVGFLLYSVSLKRSVISTAYPVMVTTTMIIVTVFTAMFDRTVSFRELAGIGCVLFGVWLLVERR